MDKKLPQVEVELVIFTVVTDDGKAFNVRPRGTVEQRRVWLEETDNLTGALLTVRYQELSEDSIPIFPVGIAIRDYTSILTLLIKEVKL